MVLHFQRVVRLALAGLLLGTGPAWALESVTLQLKWTHAFQFAGYYAALHQGYYREAGLDVRLLEGRPEIDTVDQVVSGRADFGVGTSALLLARQAGQPVVALAAIFQHSPQVIIARQSGPGHQGLLELAGKRLMIEPQSEELLAYLKQQGLQPTSLKRVAHSFDPRDLIDGRVDAMSAYLTRDVYHLQQKGMAYQIYTPRAAGIDFYGDNLFTSEQQLKQHPQRVEAFRSASLRGWRYAMAHPEEIVELLATRYAPRQPRGLHAFEARQMMSLLEPDLIEIGYMSPSRWRHIARIYADQGMLAADFALEGFLYGTAPPAPSGRLSSLSNYLAAALTLVGAIGVLALYAHRANGRLRTTLADSQFMTQREHTRGHALELLARGASLPDVLKAIALGLEEGNPAMRCSIQLLAADGQHLRVGAAPSLPDFYVTAIDGLEIGPGVGSCGTAAFLGRRVIVEDIQRHPYWAQFQALARAARLGSCWSEPIRSASGKILGTFAIYHSQTHTPTPADIELIEQAAQLAAIAIERAASIEALRVSEERHRLLADNAQDVIWTMDLAGRFTYVSPSVQKLRGYTPQEVMRQSIDEALTPESAAFAKDALAELVRAIQSGDPTPEVRAELEHPCKDGSTVWTEATTTVMRDSDGQFVGILGVTRDITERREHQQRLARLALHDALTGLPNRVLLDDRLQQALALAGRTDTRLALLFLDLDGFKPINDRFGHAVGDLLLKAVAKRLQDCLRAADTVARLGGDEFVILLPRIASAPDAALIAEKIRRTLAAPFEVQGLMLQVTSSIGVAVYPDHGHDAATLTHHADTAMYRAKHGGRDAVATYDATTAA